jgi:transcriptional antiterminator
VRGQPDRHIQKQEDNDVRFPNQRLAQLFMMLQNETLPQDELAQRLSVSTRTVRADITALNALLESHGAQFILNRGSGYQLKIDDATRYETLQAERPRTLRIPRSGPERVHYLLLRFLTSAFSIKLEDWLTSGLSAAPRCKMTWRR